MSPPPQKKRTDSQMYTSISKVEINILIKKYSDSYFIWGDDLGFWSEKLFAESAWYSQL